jgi:hypothetical protein
MHHFTKWGGFRLNLGIFIYWWVCTKPINWAVMCMCVMGTHIDSFVSVPMIFLLKFETVLTVWQFSFYDLKCWRHHQCILAYPYMLNAPFLCGGPCYSYCKSSGLRFSFFVSSSSCVLCLMFSMSLKCRFLIAPRFFLIFT